MQLEPDGKTSSRPEVFQVNPRVAVAQDGPPITSRGFEFKAPRHPGMLGGIRPPSTYPPETVVNVRDQPGRIGGVRNTGSRAHQRESAASGNDRQGSVPLRLIQGVAGSNPVSPTEEVAGQRPFPPIAEAVSSSLSPPCACTVRATAFLAGTKDAAALAASCSVDSSRCE